MTIPKKVNEEELCKHNVLLTDYCKRCDDEDYLESEDDDWDNDEDDEDNYGSIL